MTLPFPCFILSIIRNLKQAVDGLSDWLLEETQTREADIRRLGGKGHLLVVL
jgi:hypothetical protein